MTRREPARSRFLAAACALIFLLPAVAAAGRAMPQPPPLERGQPVETDTRALRDGGFETDDAAWRLAGRKGRPFRTDRGAFAGATAARLCGVPGCDQRLSQTFRPPPADGGALLLDFRLRIETAEPPGGACQDAIAVLLAAGDAPPNAVGRTCDEATRLSYVAHQMDVTALAGEAAAAGEPLTLTFAAATDDDEATTAFWLDAVRIVRADRPPGPPNVPVSGGPFSAYSEPHVAVDPEDPARLVGAAKFFHDNARYRFRVGTFASADGGQTWREGGILRGLSGFGRTSDPVVAFGPDGAVFVSVIAVRDAPSDWGVFVYRSGDGGATFGPPVAADVGTTNDKAWLAVDTSDGPHRGTVYVVWQDRCVTFLARSTDGGASFRPRQCLADACAGAQVAVGPDGTVYVVAPIWIGERFSEGGVQATPETDPETESESAPPGTGEGEIRVRFELLVSRDGGATFAAPVVAADVPMMPFVLEGGFRAVTLAQLAIMPETGTLLLAWNDARGGDADVWLTRSTDDGRSFSEPARVHAETGGDQFQPVLAAAGGEVVLAWFDRASDPDNRLADLVLARSADDGASFGPPVRASTQRFDPSLAAPTDGSGALFFGDYQGLAIAGGVAIPFWNDPRTGLQRIWSARLPVTDLPAA